MNINAIVQFLITAREHESAKGLLGDFEHLLNQYHFEYYGVLRQPRSHEDPMSLVLAGRWPQGWPEIYVSKKYVLMDPTIRYLSQAQGGFRWRTTLKSFKNDPQYRRMEQMFRDSAKFGLKDGYVFPVHGRQGLLGNMTIGGEVVDLSPVEISLFEQVARLMFFELVRFSAKSDEGSLHEEQEAVRFTRRELEVLHFLADGRTSQEIGKILRLSSHTVDWYMNSIQEKLQARNRQHAVALAFRQGLIS
jgi:LuxR family transcriptional regulator, quorum-sensing system regulator SdiA